MNKIIVIVAIVTATLLTSAFGLRANATETLNPLKDYNSSKIALLYIEALTTGNTDFTKYLFTPNFEYQNTASNTVANRKQYTNFLNRNKGYTYNCTTAYNIIEQVGNISIVKATMTFPTFYRVDFITIIQTKEGWQISKVVTTYP